MWYRRLFFPCLLLLLFSACGLSEPDRVRPLTGIWEGQTSLQGTTYTFRFDLFQAQTQISGSGTMTSPQGSFPFTVSGNFLPPTLSWTLTFEDRPPVTLSGSVLQEEGEIQATLSGSGFGGETIRLRPQ